MILARCRTMMGSSTRPNKTAPDRSQRPLRLRVDLWEKRQGGKARSTRVLTPGQPPKKRAPRGVALIPRLDTITLISASTPTRENHTPNRASGHLFSSPHLTCFALARARSGPGARDEARTGSLAVSGTARLAVRQRHAAAPKIRVSDLVSRIAGDASRQFDFYAGKRPPRALLSSSPRLCGPPPLLSRLEPLRPLRRPEPQC